MATSTSEDSEGKLGIGSNEESASTPSDGKARLFPSTRLTVTIMMFFGCVISFMLRLNIGFAMVCMIKSTKIRHNISNTFPSEYENVSIFNASYAQATHTDETCEEIYRGSPEDVTLGEFEWNKSLQGALLGANFYGNLITQVAAGWMADRYGGKTVLTVGLGVLSVSTLALPEIARFNPYVMLGFRIAQGLFSAASFPAIHSIISKWAPPTEIGLLMNIAYSGLNVGTLVLFPLSGFLCKYKFFGGWPSVFYVTGIIGIVYVIGLTFLVYDGYESHPRISLTEKKYLQTTLIGHHQAGKKIKIPWVKFITSKPVWAIVIAHFSGNWGFYTLVLILPLFMKEVLKFDIQQNGLLSALPNLSALIFKLVFGLIADYARRCNTISLTAQRKIFNSFGMFLPAICMLVITFLDCQQRYLAVGAFAACHGLSGIGISGGYFYNHVDLSPKHAGSLMGITNTFATLPGILVPMITGLLTPSGSKEEWMSVFYIATGTYVLGGAAYLLFGSGERQPWSFSGADAKPQPERGQDNPTFTMSDPDVFIVSHKKLSN